MIEVFNELGVDFGCFGNHEFDYGYDSVKRVLAGTYADDDDTTEQLANEFSQQLRQT